MDNVCDPTAPVTTSEWLEAYLSPNGIYYDEELNFLPATTLPGEQEAYSNVGTGLAGYLLELVTGQSINEYMQQQIFEPLQMSRTNFDFEFLQQQDDETILATPNYRMDETTVVPLPAYSAAFLAGGRLRTTADDIARFMGALLNDGTLPKNEVEGDEEDVVLAPTRFGGRNVPTPLCG